MVARSISGGFTAGVHKTVTLVGSRARGYTVFSASPVYTMIGTCTCAARRLGRPRSARSIARPQARLGLVLILVLSVIIWLRNGVCRLRVILVGLILTWRPAMRMRRMIRITWWLARVIRVVMWRALWFAHRKTPYGAIVVV